MGFPRSFTTAAAVVALCIVGSACSSKSGSTTAGSTSSAAGKATGSPIKVMAIIDEISSNATVSVPQLHAGLQAGINRINSNGGLGGSGHPLQVEFCATELDPNAANSCVRKAQGDSSIVAFVGSLVSEPIDGLIEASGLADIGPLPVISGNYTDKNLFAAVGGGLSANGGQANMMATILHKSKLSAGVLGIPAAVASVDLTNAVLKSCRAPNVMRTVQVPLTATDVSSYVASMANGADGIVTGTTPAQAQQFLVALKRAGSTIPMPLVNSQLNPVTIKSLGSTLEGTPVVGYFPPSNSTAAGNKEYLADMAAAGQSDNLNDNAELGWVATQLLNYAVKGQTTFTRESILAAMNKVNGFTADGLLPPLDFTKSGPLADYRRIVNPTYYPGVVKDGKIVTFDGGPAKAVNVFCS